MRFSISGFSATGKASFAKLKGDAIRIKSNNINCFLQNKLRKQVAVNSP
jgi:hypothetical protein